LSGLDLAPLWLSVKVAAVATLLALGAGLLLGWVVARTRLPGRTVLEALCMLPLVLPPTVLGYALLVLMGRDGPLGAWLRLHFDYSLVFHWHGAVLASALVALPLVLKGSEHGAGRRRCATGGRGAHPRAVGLGGVRARHPAAGLARHPGRHPAGLCARAG
jgi:ABC-type molybdate transport system permease subunit